MAVITNVIALDRKRGGANIKNYVALIQEGYEPMPEDGMEYWYRPTHLRKDEPVVAQPEPQPASTPDAPPASPFQFVRNDSQDNKDS
jgi:hypothetical protein